MDMNIEIVWQLEQVFEPYRIMLKKLGGEAVRITIFLGGGGELKTTITLLGWAGIA